MAKVMIWPDIYKEHGHWLPTIHLARKLQGESHDVEFMGIPDTESIVAPYHATFNTILADIYPLGHSVENRLEPKHQRWKPHHLLPIARGDLGELFEGAGKADLLISGYFTALETLILHRKYGVPFVFTTTFLRNPAEDPLTHAMTKLVHMPAAVAQRLISETTGGSHMSLEEFVAPLDDFPELIPCPRVFDFDDEERGEHRATVHYVEPMIERDLLGPGDPPADPIGELPEGKRLIFGTAGSQVQDYEGLARQYFVSLVQMMQTAGMGDYHLVLAVGDRLMSYFTEYFKIGSSSTTLPKNVSMYSWVSQLDIMEKAEAIFMHGGLATIKESVWEEVPIIIMPHGKDQMDNAMRIRRKGIGVVSRAQDLSPAELRKLFTQATASRWIKKNLAKMRAVFEQHETEAPSLAVIQGVLAS